jgi:predicted dehydrogenase
VKAMSAKVLFAREVEDTATALFQFARGTCGVLTVTHAAQEPQDTLHIFSSQGSIHVPVLNEGSLRIVSAQDERIESHPPAANWHTPLIQDFVAAVFDNREPGVNGDTGRSVAMIEEQIYHLTSNQFSQGD